MEGANLVFVVMLIVIPICLFAGIARTLIAGSHSRAGHGTLTSPAGTRQRPNTDRQHLIRAAARFLPLIWPR